MKKEYINQKYGSILIIVPHQDDEILMSAGVIKQAVDNNVPVHVVMVTNGDYECKDHSVGEMRLKETLRGTQLLGLKEDDVTILGYADTGMPVEDSFLTHLYEESNSKKVYSSSCGNSTYGLKNKQEYHMQKYGKHASYCREALKQDIKEVIQMLKPVNIMTTSQFDVHGDHSALFGFVVEILRELKLEDGYVTNLYEGLIHSNAGDEIWPLRDSNIYTCPDNLENVTTLKWDDRISIPVPECMRQCRGKDNLKYKALLQYETALEPNAVDFLMSFNKEEEIFWRVQY